MNASVVRNYSDQDDEIFTVLLSCVYRMMMHQTDLTVYKTNSIHELKPWFLCTDQEVMTESMEVLRKMFGNDIPDPIDIVVPDWIDDPLTYGTYTSWPTGYGNNLLITRVPRT